MFTKGVQFARTAIYSFTEIILFPFTGKWNQLPYPSQHLSHGKSIRESLSQNVIHEDESFDDRILS